MIELFDEHGKALGFIDGGIVLDKKRKPAGKIDPDAIRDKNGEIVLNITSDGKISHVDEEPGSQGYVKAGKIFDSADGLLYAYQQKTGEVIDETGGTRVVVKGDTSKFADRELVGMATIFFELFA
nr:hypothetical protein [Candidatus Sigynarchaeum springense]